MMTINEFKKNLQNGINYLEDNNIVDKGILGLTDSLHDNSVNVKVNTPNNEYKQFDRWDNTDEIDLAPESDASIGKLIIVNLFNHYVYNVKQAIVDYTNFNKTFSKGYIDDLVFVFNMLLKADRNDEELKNVTNLQLSSYTNANDVRNDFKRMLNTYATADWYTDKRTIADLETKLTMLTDGELYVYSLIIAIAIVPPTYDAPKDMLNLLKSVNM